MTLYPESRLFEEMAYLAYFLHWPIDDLLDMEHPLRARIVGEVERLNDATSGGV
jgi:hypothetical protein